MITPRVTLVTGGARCGKSGHALRLALAHPHPAFVATAEALDDEMEQRIRRHREERGADFTTVEEPRDPAAALDRLPEGCGAAVVDCITVWLTNLMHRAAPDGDHVPPAEPGAYPQVGAFLDRLERPPCRLVVVTNEVGWGVVPATPLGRAFRDLAGWVNQALARRADRVILMVSGIPMVVKEPAAERGDTLG